MTKLEMVIEELKILPPKKIEDVASYVHALKEEEWLRCQAVLEATEGCLTGKLGEEFEKAIEDCERIDPREW
ncbi:MAG: hypothetical protein GKR87_01755 [Kiritimatiellae bacterium]|nr:hypothetical protein [Kiritimatiellia bacterium]